MTEAFSPEFGLSSGSLPSADAHALSAATQQAGGTVVDIRTAKGHQWEARGLAEGIATIRNSGVGVAFLGTSWRLGDPQVEVSPGLPTDIPLKVFCRKAPDPAALRKHLATIRRYGYEVWIETHQGGPSPSDLARLAEEYGFGLVVDNLGLADTIGDDPVPWRGLAPFIRAVQVKGFDAGLRHRALTESDLGLLVILRELGTAPNSVTVETRAGTALSDLELLLRWNSGVHW